MFIRISRRMKLIFQNIEGVKVSVRVGQMFGAWHWYTHFRAALSIWIEIWRCSDLIKVRGDRLEFFTFELEVFLSLAAILYMFVLSDWRFKIFGLSSPTVDLVWKLLKLFLLLTYHVLQIFYFKLSGLLFFNSILLFQRQYFEAFIKNT